MVEKLIDLVNERMQGKGEFTALENERNILVEKTTINASMRVVLNRKTMMLTITHTGTYKMLEA